MELQISKSYWATINWNQNGEILISNLKDRPRVLALIKDSTPKLAIDKLKDANFSENLESKINSANYKNVFYSLCAR